MTAVAAMSARAAGVEVGLTEVLGDARAPGLPGFYELGLHGGIPGFEQEGVRAAAQTAAL